MINTTTYYLYLKERIVVGYYSYPIDSENIPKGEKIIEVETDTPSNYLGLDEKQIFLNPLPEVNHDLTDRDSLDYRRSELKRLYYDIIFTNELKEDSSQLLANYNRKKEEYFNKRNN